MDVTQSFKFVFDDPKWVMKVAIDGLINFSYLVLYFSVSLALALVGLAAAGGLAATLIGAPLLILSLGYAIQVTRNVISGVPPSQTMPEWSTFEQIARDGIKVWAVHFLLFLPVLVFSTLSNFLSATGDAGSSAIALVLACLNIFLALGAGLLYPVAMGRYAVTGDVVQALNVATLIDTFKRHAQRYLLLFLLEIAAGFIAAAGLIACGVGFVFTSFYAMLVIFHLIGQAYRDTQEVGPVGGPVPYPLASGPPAYPY